MSRVADSFHREMFTKEPLSFDGACSFKDKNQFLHHRLASKSITNITNYQLQAAMSLTADTYY